MPPEAAEPVILEQKLIGQKRFLRFYVPDSHLRGNDGGGGSMIAHNARVPSFP